jgi:hypothetical protein
MEKVKKKEEFESGTRTLLKLPAKHFFTKFSLLEAELFNATRDTDRKE